MTNPEKGDVQRRTAGVGEMTNFVYPPLTSEGDNNP